MNSSLEKKQSIDSYLDAEYKNGEIICRPASRLGSHMLTSALGANCILGSDSGDGPLKPGDLIKIKLLPWKTL